MNKVNVGKLWNIIIYVLIVILVILIFYDLYQLANRYNSNKIYHNSINVSPITGRRIQPVTTSNALLEVKYSNLKLKNLMNINDADIIYETYNKEKDVLRYSAVFYNKEFKIHDSMEVIKTIDLSNFPKFNFMDIVELPKYNFLSDCDTIFIKFSLNRNSSFTYNGEGYLHYSDTIIDKHFITNQPLIFSNVIVQFVNSNEESSKDTFSHSGSGEGFLFSGGKVQPIYWNNNNFFLSDKTTPITLMRGNTYWIIATNNTEVITSKCLVSTDKN
ncbi:hypothetical protein CPJCM30710_25960 [Clostridium polyendosporum]|uniref:DUF3048 domain-containing protein n=1 Tax=Clostridium polyendosporum TaxID=69208 RepID=A0A919S0E5_9CLOT|nr:DUF3048 C-terminal domain-containing protein [Clostridium polyendosporum]GIM29930.1 hypothetical protein CPJCM30710_25960 [Clostridium polyendosporum]